jgi:hypothetical protein
MTMMAREYVWVVFELLVVAVAVAVAVAVEANEDQWRSCRYITRVTGLLLTATQGWRQWLMNVFL